MTAPLVNTALELSYDGRLFHGWQRHGRQATVQGAVEDAVREAFGLASVVQGSGRTDRGAHALAQIASVLLPGSVDPSEVPAALNAVLAEGVAVERAVQVPADFHARHSALAKTYRYALWVGEELDPAFERRVWHVKGPLDVEAMERVMPLFLGEHDFASFATKSKVGATDTIRTMMESTLHAELPIIEMSFTANGFLYKMVRNLVRAVVKTGEGRYSRRRIERILAARDRSEAPGTAPASGLYLDAVHYDPPLFPE